MIERFDRRVPIVEMPNVRDIAPPDFIKAYASHLKRAGKLHVEPFSTCSVREEGVRQRHRALGPLMDF
jgi:hypothetical protein